MGYMPVGIDLKPQNLVHRSRSLDVGEDIVHVSMRTHSCAGEETQDGDTVRTLIDFCADVSGIIETFFLVFVGRNCCPDRISKRDCFVFVILNNLLDTPDAGSASVHESQVRELVYRTIGTAIYGTEDTGDGVESAIFLAYRQDATDLGIRGTTDFTLIKHSYTGVDGFG